MYLCHVIAGNVNFVGKVGRYLPIGEEADGMDGRQYMVRYSPGGPAVVSK